MNDGSPLGLPPEVLAVLREHQTLALATVSPTGAPHAATLLYADDGLRLVCRIPPESATARHVEANPAVAFAIAAGAADWRAATAIEGSGTARIVPQPEAGAPAASRFRSKFPGAADGRIDEPAWLELTPTELWFVGAEGGGAAATEIDALERVSRRRLVYAAGFSRTEPAPSASAIATVQAPAGTAIVRQGEPGETFYIVLDGEVAVLREEGGRQRRIETLRRGQFFGEIAVLRGTPRTATVQATGPTTLLAMDREALLDLVDRSAGTAADFRRVVEQRLAQLGYDVTPPAADVETGRRGDGET